jgi:hypothetical protein
VIGQGKVALSLSLPSSLPSFPLYKYKRGRHKKEEILVSGLKEKIEKRKGKEKGEKQKRKKKKKETRENKERKKGKGRPNKG